MSVLHSEIRPGAYYDSIVLMQLQASLARLPGVADAAVVMASAANLELLESSGLRPPDLGAVGSNDLVIAVRAQSEASALAALEQVDGLLERRRAAVAGEYRPRGLATAVRALPDARWVLVSVPGRYAARVAREALELGRHVFLYSDNVALADEVALKQRATERGLLVMGPDCGTAVVGGIGLGFANRLRRGPVGLVGASGTGLQLVTSRLDALGVGVSQVIGTGGRDLSAAVGAATARQGLELLARDPETRVVVLVSKPPAPAVAARLLALAQTLGKPVVVSFVGWAPPLGELGSVRFARNLAEAAEIAAGFVGQGHELKSLAPSLRPSKPRIWLRGLFAGGTLAVELLHGLESFLDPLFSNVALRPEQRHEDSARSRGHAILDLGADEYTVGRLHPMIDQELRLRRFRQEAADPEVALLLLDVVLGDGAHPDPATELAPEIAACREHDGPEVVVLIVGTEADPQGLGAQVEQLEQAGAIVLRDPREVIAHVASRLSSVPSPSSVPVALEAFKPEVAAINVGLESFHQSLLVQGARAVQVDWRPPAGGDEKLIDLLDKITCSTR